MGDLVGFLILTVALSATPGPDDVLVLRYSVSAGSRYGAAVAVGAAAGTLTWGAATAIGLAAAVSRSDMAYGLLRGAGAVYLVALGIAGFATQRRGRWGPIGGGSRHGVREQEPQARSLRNAFVAGCLSDLLNPKIGLFYLAVLPQFIPPGQPVLGWSALLCAIDIAVALTWLLLLARLAGAALGWLRRPRVEVWLERFLSASLIGVGAAVSLGI